MPQTVLITGTSSGIGHAAVLFFAARNWNVVATMRNPSCAGAKAFASHDNILVTRLDVTDRQSVDEAVKQGLEKFGGLDVVVNNAGYALTGPMEFATEEKLLKQYETNVFGPIRVMQAVLPYYRRKGKGLIINVTSVGGRLTIPFCSLYHGTKFALEGISESINLELAPLGIRIKILEPGGVKTDFAGRSLDMMQSETIRDYDDMIARAMETYGGQESSYSTSEQIAETIFEAATDGKDKVRYPAGKDAIEMLKLRGQISDEEHEKNTTERFNLLGKKELQAAN